MEDRAPSIEGAGDAGHAVEEGLRCHRAGRLKDAAAWYEEARAQEPDNFQAVHLLGVARKQQGRLEDAVGLLKRAIEIDPQAGVAHYNLGNTVWFRDELERALACYGRALELLPDYVDAWVNHGRTLQQLGRTEEAIDSYRQALAVEPSSGKTWENLITSRRNVVGDDEIAQMRAELQKDRDPRSEDTTSLHFALANVLDERGEHEGAFAHYAAGNGIRRARAAYDIATEEGVMANIARQVDSDVIERLREAGNASAKPIFILGMPRSGTTLVEQIVASHPRVMGGGERTDLEYVVKHVKLSDGSQPGYPIWVPKLNPDDPQLVAQAYLDRLPALADGEDRITDKMPANFRFVGLIHLMLPKAAIVHVHRSPADTCLSCYKQNFTRGHRYSSDQLELGRYYRAYSDLMRHWRAVLPEGAFLDVRYEDVVADPEGQVARLLDHCGLEWDARCLRFHETDRPVQTASMEQVRQPLYAKSVGRWRTYAPYLGPLFTALGDLAPLDEQGRDRGA